MKSTNYILGILLIIFGVLVFAYQGFTYTKNEKIAQIGSVEVSADKEKTVYFPPVVGGIALVAGIALVSLGRKK